MPRLIRMRVNIISLNVDGLERSPELDLPKKLQPNPDIYVEFTQEDGRHVNPSKLAKVNSINNVSNNNVSNDAPAPGLTNDNMERIRQAVEEKEDANAAAEEPNYSTFQAGGADNITLIDTNELKGMKLAAHISLNPVKTKQNIITNIFVRDGLHPKVEMGGIAVKPKAGKVGKLIAFAQGVASHIPGLHLGHSKGCVWVKLDFGMQSILFINMHLPVKTSERKNGTLKNVTLGYEFRKKMFYGILKKLSDMVGDYTHVIVGGDLNFRMSADGTDQLTELLRQNSPKNSIPLKELHFPAGEEPSFTCKFKEHSDKNCRLTHISEHKKLACADESRVPSRCDRFLVMGNPKVSLYDTGVLLDQSDHNAIYASFDIGSQGGGRRLTRRKRRVHD